jgi:hypothetical protein
MKKQQVVAAEVGPRHKEERNMHYKAYYRYLIVVGLLVLGSIGSIAEDGKDAKVRINVKPNQAYVYVDGTPVGSSSRNITVTAGKHTIGVYNYGFTPQVQEVSLNSGRNEDLNVALVAVPGTVSGPWGRIQIEGASSAAIYLNGKTPEYLVAHGDETNNSGTLFACCTQELIVPAGTHQIMAVWPNSEKTWSGSVDVPTNKRVVVNVNSGSQKVKDWPESAGLNSVDRFSAGMASATIAVAPVSGALKTESAKINCGDSSRLSWQTSETVERVITADSETLKQPDPTGSLSVQPKKATAYKLQASGPGGTVTSEATVDVNAVVQSSIEASPPEVKYRRIGDKVLVQETSSLIWKASNANSTVIDPLGTVAANGAQTVQTTPKQDSNGPVNEVHTYTLTAKNECGGSNTQTTSLRVIGSIEPVPDVPLVSVFFPTAYPTEGSPEAGLVPSQQEALDRTADGFKKYLEYDPEAKLTVVGHADERDSNDRNQPLSERRAYRVKGYLISLGVPANNIEAIAQGDTQNLDESVVASLSDKNPNKLENVTDRQRVWAYNRRVDLQLLSKGETSAQLYPGNAPEADFLANPQTPGEKEILTLAGEKENLPTNPTPKQ